MDKDGKIYLPEKVRGLKVSLISAPNMPDGEAVMVVNGKDFERIKPKEKKQTYGKNKTVPKCKSVIYITFCKNN
jgi:hypothetical protein